MTSTFINDSIAYNLHIQCILYLIYYVLKTMFYNSSLVENYKNNLLYTINDWTANIADTNSNTV